MSAVNPIPSDVPPGTTGHASPQLRVRSDSAEPSSTSTAPAEGRTTERSGSNGEAHCPIPTATIPGGMEAAIEREPSRFKRCLMILGPGLTSGASNNDPSAISTYARAGAMLGFAPLWAAPVLLPMMATVVFLCAKVGMVSGRGLAGVLRHNYPKWVLFPVVFALLLANTFNAGADVGAIADGLGLLLPIIPPGVVRYLGVPVALGILTLQIWGSYRLITNLFKWLTLTLFAFVVAGVLAKPELREVLLRTVVPSVRFDAVYISTLVAMVGTALSPYLYFWQTSQRVEEEVCMGRRRLWQRQGATEGELKYAAMDVNTGMTVACVVIYFIILATAATLHETAVRRGLPPPEINSARDAAAALEPLAGKLAGALFALGFIGAGLLAVPVLTTGAAYAVCDAFGWKSGLDQRVRAAPQFYAVIVLSTLAGIAVTFLGIHPMTALFWAAVVNGLLAPPVLVLVMLISRNRAVMGERTSTRWQSILGWTTTAVTFAAAISFLVTLVRG